MQFIYEAKLIGFLDVIPLDMNKPHDPIINLVGANLVDVDLSGAFLSGANLVDALQPHFLNAAIKSLEQG